ncbi:transposase [Moraxella caviae]|uniref:transposase n=1 Tax=Moraxella caviae TaxID=34060 RepID=UPI001559617B
MNWTPKGRKQLKKHLRWLLIKRLAQLSSDDLKTLEVLAKEYPKLVIAYYLKEKFFDIYEAKDKNAANIGIFLNGLTVLMSKQQACICLSFIDLSKLLNGISPKPLAIGTVPIR